MLGFVGEKEEMTTVKLFETDLDEDVDWVSCRLGARLPPNGNMYVETWKGASFCQCVQLSILPDHICFITTAQPIQPPYSTPISSIA